MSVHYIKLLNIKIYVLIDIRVLTKENVRTIIFLYFNVVIHHKRCQYYIIDKKLLEKSIFILEFYFMYIISKNQQCMFLTS